MTADTLRVLVVLFSSGLGPAEVVSFHERVAAGDRRLREELGIGFMMELCQVDRPLTIEDFRDASGRLRLDPAAVADDVRRRGVEPEEYPLLLVYFRSGEAGPVYALAQERGKAGVQVSVAADGSLSVAGALLQGLRAALEGRSLESPARPPSDGRFEPLYNRVVLSAGNRSVFLPYRGRPAPDQLLRLAGRTKPFELLRVEGGAYAGAWIDLPLGESEQTADAGGGAVTLVERHRVGYVEAHWQESGRGPAVLQADVREEAFGGTLRVPHAKLTVVADDERIVLREFPGGMHIGQRANGPRPVEVVAEVNGVRIKSAVLTGKKSPGASTSPLGSWIEGEVRY